MTWIEIRVTQGHDYTAVEEAETTGAVENAVDRPAQDLFCEAEDNFLFCYAFFDAERVPIGRLQLIQFELQNAITDPGRAVDELNVVDGSVVAERFPSVLPIGSEIRERMDG